MHSTFTRPPTCEFKSNFYFCVANTLLVIKIKRTSYYTVRVQNVQWLFHTEWNNPFVSVIDWKSCTIYVHIKIFIFLDI